MDEFDSTDVFAGLLWWEHLVKRAFGVRIEIVAHQADPFTIRKTSIQMCRHF